MLAKYQYFAKLHSNFQNVLLSPPSTEYFSLKNEERDQTIWKCMLELHIAISNSLFYLIFSIFMYRTRAIIGRSQLVTAPLSFQAKAQFLCHFYVIILGLKM